MSSRRLPPTYRAVQAQIQESHEADPVVDLVFRLVVAQVEQPRQYQNLEHHASFIIRKSFGALRSVV